MTIKFIPGEVNDSETSVAHGRWKNHYVIVYGSGNNLIINTITFGQKPDENLQTLYLEFDPSSLDINLLNGYIAMGLGLLVVVFTPINEYMKKPRWQKSMVILVLSSVNCVQWAAAENEIVVGTNDSIVLIKVYRDLGLYKHHIMWVKEQPLAIQSVKITFNSNKIVARGGPFDRFLKVWSRISYGEDNTMFELTYLSHDRLDFVTYFKWRFRLYDSTKTVDGSMANIKNIRHYIDTGGSDDADILFTFSHNKEFRVWSTYETSGHSTIKCWAKLDLTNTFENLLLIVAVFTIDNYYLQKTLFNQLEGIDSEFSSYFKNQRFDNVDLLFVISNTGQVAIYLILNVANIPPNSIQFERVDNRPMYFNGNCFLEFQQSSLDMMNPDPNVISPVIIPKILLFDPQETKLSVLLHNRIRGTIKFNTLNFTQFLKDDEFIGTKLINKLEGHDKSIRKLVKSDDGVILSILNFSNDNNIWRSLDVDGKVIITKDSYIDLDLRDGEKADTLCIIDALILPDYVLTFDSLGYLTVWDHKKEDDNARFICTNSLPIVTPKFFEQISDKILIYLDKLYCWELDKCGRLEAQAIPDLPEFHKLSKFDDGIALMDSKGVLGKYNIINNNWTQSFSIETNIENCSAAIGFKNKLAFVDNLGTKLFIWDLKSRILEFEQLFEEPVRDIDWCNIGGSMLLSVGFKRSVVLYTELRYDYTNHLPTYSMLKKIDISDYTSHEIGDSLWINDGYLVIGSGNQFFVDDRGFEIGSSSDAINNMTRQLVKGYQPGSDDSAVYDIRDIVKLLNGPLPYYHPQFLVQLLYMNQYDLVHLIVVRLYQKLRSEDVITWFPNFSIIDEILYKPTKLEGDDVFNTFNDHLVEILVQQLAKTTLPSLTRHQQMTLISLMHILTFLEKYRSHLDDNGMRFLVGFKLFQMSKQQALNMRDINFALHSTNKDLLISIIEETYNYQFTLELIKSLGLVYWVHNFKLQEIVENLVKNEFNESRDPSGLISLLYITLNKKQVLVGLWRIVSHKEKDKILKFLANDFSDSRWKTAAMKNAFALLGKHRYMDSAYFFLLADKVKDCCNMINNKLQDFQLSLLVSKLYNFVRTRDIDNTLIIENYLVKKVIEDGNKWMSSWMFWELGDKNSSIQALIKPPLDVIKPKLKIPSKYSINYSASKFYDPALILLFNSIKSKRKEYQMGSLAIDLKQETDFLLNICLIYTKMGCDFLALILLKNWEFGEAEVAERKTKQAELIAPPAQVFEEPDMSAFDFGF